MDTLESLLTNPVVWELPPITMPGWGGRCCLSRTVPEERRERGENKVSCSVQSCDLEPVSWAEAMDLNVSYFSSLSIYLHWTRSRGKPSLAMRCIPSLNALGHSAAVTVAWSTLEGSFFKGSRAIFLWWRFQNTHQALDCDPQDPLLGIWGGFFILLLTGLSIRRYRLVAAGHPAVRQGIHGRLYSKLTVVCPWLSSVEWVCFPKWALWIVLKVWGEALGQGSLESSSVYKFRNFKLKDPIISSLNLGLWLKSRDGGNSKRFARFF